MSIYDKATLVQIPSGYKASGAKLYSVLPANGDGDFTVSTDADATRIDENGLIETTVANQARLSRNFIDGVVQPDPFLLLEPTRTNLCLYSKTLSSWSVLNGASLQTINDNDAIAPDGTQTASTITFLGNGSSLIRHFSSTSYTSAKHSCSFWVKKISGNGTVEFGLNDTETEFIPTDKWVRHEINNITPTNFGVNLFLDLNFICSAGDKIAVWGMQLEEGTYSTSLISTNGSAVTRTKDTCINGGNNALFNDTEGVVFLDVEVPNSSSEVKQTSLNNGTTNEAVKILQLNGTTFRFEVVMASGTNFSQDVTVNPYQRNKLALQYKANDYKVFVNGTKQSVTQRSTLPSGLDRFNFNRGYSTTDDFTGSVYQLMVFNTALTDAELIALTS